MLMIVNEKKSAINKEGSKIDELITVNLFAIQN